MTFRHPLARPCRGVLRAAPPVTAKRVSTFPLLRQPRSVAPSGLRQHAPWVGWRRSLFSLGRAARVRGSLAAMKSLEQDVLGRGWLLVRRRAPRPPIRPLPPPPIRLPAPLPQPPIQIPAPLPVPAPAPLPPPKLPCLSPEVQQAMQSATACAVKTLAPAAVPPGPVSPALVQTPAKMAPAIVPVPVPSLPAPAVPVPPTGLWWKIGLGVVGVVGVGLLLSR